MGSSRKALLKNTIFAIHSPFLLPPFSKREENNQSRDFQSCLLLDQNWREKMPGVPFHLYNLFALSSLDKQSFIIIIIFTAIQYNYWMEILAENSFNYCGKKVIIDVCLLECCFFLKLSCQRKYNLFFPYTISQVKNWIENTMIKS